MKVKTDLRLQKIRLTCVYFGDTYSDHILPYIPLLPYRKDSFPKKCGDEKTTRSLNKSFDLVVR